MEAAGEEDTCDKMFHKRSDAGTREACLRFTVREKTCWGKSTGGKGRRRMMQ